MNDQTVVKPVPMRHCFNCGAELGRYRDYDRLDTCGEQECEKAARDAARDYHDDPVWPA